MKKDTFNANAGSWSTFRHKALAHLNEIATSTLAGAPVEMITPQAIDALMAQLDRFEKIWPDIQDFHIHLYFEESPSFEENSAAVVAGALKISHADAILRISSVGIVGPHTQRNIEIDIKRDSVAEVMGKILRMGHWVPYLLHPETGDDLKDHLEYSVWPIREMPYNEKFFDALRAGQNLPPVNKTPLQPKP